jgi:dTDP-4-amino-4,6-dideoxygalactose transaminase
MTQTIDLLGREPLLQKPRAYPLAGTAERNALADALAGPWGRGSSTMTHAERAFAKAHKLPASHAATMVTNGTHAIVIALEALDIGVDDVVLCPTFTWQATADAVLEVNATPVLIDVNPKWWTIDVDRVQAYIEACLEAKSRLPKAIIAVHIYQRAAELDRLLALCEQYGIWLIEDCAHAHGASYAGHPIGTVGVIGTFSFESTKPITCGEGGAVVTGVPELERRIRSLQDCGREVDATISPHAPASAPTRSWRDRVAATPELHAPTLQSGPHRPTAPTAALLAVQAERFPAEHELRSAGLRECTAALEAFDGVTVPGPQPLLTSAVLFKFGFTLDRGRWLGLSNRRFCEALSALLGGYLIDPPYDSLTGTPNGPLSPYYRPATKRRHHLSDNYLAAVHPKAYDGWVAEDIHRRGVMIAGPFLGEKNPGDLLTDALSWIRAHTDELADD